MLCCVDKTQKRALSSHKTTALAKRTPYSGACALSTWAFIRGKKANAGLYSGCILSCLITLGPVTSEGNIGLASEAFCKTQREFCLKCFNRLRFFTHSLKHKLQKLPFPRLYKHFRPVCYCNNTEGAVTEIQ